MAQRLLGAHCVNPAAGGGRARARPAHPSPRDQHRALEAGSARESARAFSRSLASATIPQTSALSRAWARARARSRGPGPQEFGGVCACALLSLVPAPSARGFQGTTTMCSLATGGYPRPLSARFSQSPKPRLSGAGERFFPPPAPSGTRSLGGEALQGRGQGW